MDPIKADSDAWTGRDPSRAAAGGISRATRLRLAKLMFAVGGVGLFLLGYQVATFDRWTELATPAALVLLGFSSGAREWRLGSA
jgi:hypothetical protein